jgi:type I restriction enzyme M protein
VDTFDEEEQIDINGVAKELREMNSSMEEIDHKLADFCKELNIEIPF